MRGSTTKYIVTAYTYYKNSYSPTYHKYFPFTKEEIETMNLYIYGSNNGDTIWKNLRLLEGSYETFGTEPKVFVPYGEKLINIGGDN